MFPRAVRPLHTYVGCTPPYPHTTRAAGRWGGAAFSRDPRSCAPGVAANRRSPGATPPTPFIVAGAPNRSVGRAFMGRLPPARRCRSGSAPAWGPTFVPPAVAAWRKPMAPFAPKALCARATLDACTSSTAPSSRQAPALRSAQLESPHASFRQDESIGFSKAARRYSPRNTRAMRRNVI